MTDRPVGQGDYVLYWMTAARRLGWNPALERAVAWARELRRPLVILEALRVGYPHAAARHHRFVLDGMAGHLRRLAGSRVRYLPNVEPAPGAGSGLLAALAARASVVVGDDVPHFFLPRMVAAAGRQVPVRFEVVDGAGLYPVRATSRVFLRAVDFRRHLQRALPAHLETLPAPDPLAGDLAGPAVIPDAVLRRWPMATLAELEGPIDHLPIDHAVAPTGLGGGEEAGRARWRAFLDHGLDRYAEGRNHPDDDATSGLSPFLHHGQLSVHELFSDLAERERWTPEQLRPAGRGQREGWWGLSPAAEAFLDELVTWRELGLNAAAHLADHDRYTALPAWARQTLAAHAADPRERIYTLEALDAARTHDPLWNAAQRQLRREGRIHNYLRMLWGKNILAWSPDPEAALAVMFQLNDRYALDGRDPSSVSGITWVLGRYDRAWGPERPVFGKVRYMSTGSTLRKLRVQRYLDRYGREVHDG